MVRVVFIDGTEEIFESTLGDYEYVKDTELFTVYQPHIGLVMFPREFVKYITMVWGIDIDRKLSINSMGYYWSI